MSSVLDSLMGLIESGRRKDGAATARANLEQTWDYPSLVASLPYRYYDEKMSFSSIPVLQDLFWNWRRCLAPMSR